MNGNSDNGQKSVAIYVESRNLMTYLVDVTRVPGIGLVIKCKKEMGVFFGNNKTKRVRIPLNYFNKGE